MASRGRPKESTDRRQWVEAVPPHQPLLRPSASREARLRVLRLPFRETAISEPSIGDHDSSLRSE